MCKRGKGTGAGVKADVAAVGLQQRERHELLLQRIRPLCAGQVT